MAAGSGAAWLDFSALHRLTLRKDPRAGGRLTTGEQHSSQLKLSLSLRSRAHSRQGVGKQDVINSWTQTLIRLKCKEAANEVRYLAYTQGIIYFMVSLQHFQFRRKVNDRLDESGVGKMGKEWHCHLSDEISAWMELSVQTQDVQKKAHSPIKCSISSWLPYVYICHCHHGSPCPPKLETSGLPDSHLTCGSHTHLSSSFSHVTIMWPNMVQRVKEHAALESKQTGASVTTLPQVSLDHLSTSFLFSKWTIPLASLVALRIGLI